MRGLIQVRCLRPRRIKFIATHGSGVGGGPALHGGRGFSTPMRGMIQSVNVSVAADYYATTRMDGDELEATSPTG